jgi:hypothetical protein
MRTTTTKRRRGSSRTTPTTTPRRRRRRRRFDLGPSRRSSGRAPLMKTSSTRR